MPDEIPPAPPTPPASHDDPPQAKILRYAGPIVLDAVALICTTFLVAQKIVPIEDFKYLVGMLVVGNFALRTTSGKPGGIPSGGGLLMAVVAAGATAVKGLKS